MARNKNVKLNVDLNLLKKLQKNISEKYYTKVGILAGKTTREVEEDQTINNAELGLIHEFGSKTENIPARSFLRFPLEFKGKALTNLIVKDKEKIQKVIANDGLKSVYKKLGAAAEAIIQEAFETGGFGQWPDITEATKKRKKSSSILIDTGQLRRSVTSKVVKYE